MRSEGQGERESDLALGPRERPWRVRQVRASVVEKLRADMGKISTLGVPSATLGTGSSTPRHQALCHAINL